MNALVRIPKASPIQEEMSAQLRGSKLPKPTFRSAPMPEGLKSVYGYKGLKTYYPALGRLGGMVQKSGEEVWLDSAWQTRRIDCSGTSGPCQLRIQPSKGGEEKTIPAFLKVTHILDPIRWIQGKYSLPDHPVAPRAMKTWKLTLQKLNDSWNQAYVDALACYSLGRLREEGLTPHFNQFYGAFVATADTYSYNLTEEIDSYRHSRWFWASERKGLYTLRIVNITSAEKGVPEEIMEEFNALRKAVEEGQEEAEENGSDADAEEEENSEGGSEEDADDAEDASSGSESELEEIQEAGADDAGSLHSDNMSELSLHSDKSDDVSDAESEGPAPDEFRIYCDIKQYPVMMILSEANSGTMDSLIDDHAEVGATPATYEWDERWSAWLFQILAALSCAQEVIGLTHNDLHTNNIVWTRTEEEYLWYVRRDGTTFQVPTFGKLFRIIDFGRSIYTLNGTIFISDDFRPENDAAGQYRFKPLQKTVKTNAVPPNPSFDLARLAVSLFDGLFPNPPEDKDGGAIMSSESGFTVQESISDLYNVLWSWMIDDDGANILINPDGSERFPDFDLYKHIAAKVHGAVPARQFVHPAFDRFQVIPSSVGEGVKKWSLFC